MSGQAAAWSGRDGARARRMGFTLIEMILAISLAVMVVGGILSFYDYALASREQLREEMAFIDAQRRVMDRVTDELRAAIAYRAMGMGMEGQVDQIGSFPTTRLPSAAVWVERSMTDAPLPPEHDITVVGYRLRIEENEDGEEVITGLERTEQLLVMARAVEEGEDIRATLLTEHVKFLRVRYYGDGQWMTQWTGGDLPAAVEITMGPTPVPADTDLVDFDAEAYPGPLFQRVIAIPAGYQRPAQGGARGGAVEE